MICVVGKQKKEFFLIQWIFYTLGLSRSNEKTLCAWKIVYLFWKPLNDILKFVNQNCISLSRNCLNRSSQCMIKIKEYQLENGPIHYQKTFGQQKTIDHLNNWQQFRRFRRRLPCRTHAHIHSFGWGQFYWQLLSLLCPWAAVKISSKHSWKPKKKRIVMVMLVIYTWKTQLCVSDHFSSNARLHIFIVLLFG